VGVDVEEIKPIEEIMAVAETICTDQELDMLRAAAETHKLHIFYRLWTRKEAFAKADGYGLSLPPRQIDIGALSRALPEAPLLLDGSEEAREWRCVDADPAAGYLAAVAVKRTCTGISFYTCPAMPEWVL